MGIFVKFLLIALALEWGCFQCAQLGTRWGQRRTSEKPSDEKPADETVTQLLQKLQTLMIEDGIISNSKKNALTPVSYKSQVISDEFGERSTVYFIKAEAAGKCAVIRIIHKKSPFMAKNGVSDSITLHGIGKINSCKTAIEYFDPTNPETYPDREEIRYGEQRADHKILALVRRVQYQINNYGISANFKNNELTPISYIIIKYEKEHIIETLYFVKVKDTAEGKCAVFQILTLSYKSFREDFAYSLDGMKTINTCKDEIRFFEKGSGIQKEIQPLDEKIAGPEIHELLQQVEKQTQSYGYYKRDGPFFELKTYGEKVVNGANIYFLKAFAAGQLVSERSKCFLLRVSKTFAHKAKISNGEISLDGIRQMKSCLGDIEYFEADRKQTNGKKSTEIPYSENDKNILDVISEVETQLGLRADIYNIDNEGVQPVSYIKNQTRTGTIYLIKAFLTDEEGECFLLRIREKHSRKVPSPVPGDKRASLEGFKKINSCRNEIEYFEPERLVLKRFDDEKPADGEINSLVQKVLPFKISMFDLNAPSELEVISYREKVVVEGKSYVAKVYHKFGCALIRITKTRTKVSLDGTKSMESCKDEVEFFEPEPKSETEAQFLPEEILDAERKIGGLVKYVQDKMSFEYDFFPEVREVFSNGTLYRMGHRQQIIRTDETGRSNNSYYFVKVSRREDKCLVLRISFSGKFGPSDREEDYSTANFRGMKRIGCFDEIEYFTAQPVENFTKK